MISISAINSESQAWTSAVNTGPKFVSLDGRHCPNSARFAKLSVRKVDDYRNSCKYCLFATRKAIFTPYSSESIYQRDFEPVLIFFKSIFVESSFFSYRLNNRRFFISLHPKGLYKKIRIWTRSNWNGYPWAYRHLRKSLRRKGVGGISCAKQSGTCGYGTSNQYHPLPLRAET